MSNPPFSADQFHFYKKHIYKIFTEKRNITHCKPKYQAFNAKAEDPATITLYICRKMKEPNLKQEEYETLVREVVTELFKRYVERLVSVVLYGSVARGTAHKLSDIDLIAVIEKLPESFSERIEEMVEIVDGVRSTKMRLWKEKGIYANIQIYPLTPDEAERVRLLYLDLTTDAITLYDKGAFMESVLEKTRKRLQDLGARKITLPSHG